VPIWERSDKKALATGSTAGIGLAIASLRPKRGFRRGQRSLAGAGQGGRRTVARRGGSWPWFVAWPSRTQGRA
jgi:hypothetical protein